MMVEPAWGKRCFDMDEVIRRAGDCAPRAAVESRLMWHPIFTAPKHRVILLAHFHRNGDGPLFPLWVEDAQWVGCPTCGACQFMGSASTGQVL